jgi:DNA-binding NtrC family response regulator
VPRILVVEDDRGVQEVISEFLRATGHKVYCANSAEQARDFLARQPIDLTLIDCVMSGEQGDSLADHASSLGIPTILTSGDPEYLKTVATGRLPFLGKPFRLTELDRLISRLLPTLRD